MVKILKPCLIFVLIVSLICAMPAYAASACTKPTGTSYCMNGGLNGIQYYIDSYSTPSSYYGYFSASAAEWSSKSAKINLTETTNPIYSEIDINTVQYPENIPGMHNAVAWTVLKASGGAVVTITTSNWSFATITIASAYFDNLGYMTSDTFPKYGTTAHEFGHVFGLIECGHNNTGHIMYQNSSLRSVCVPTSTDVAMVNSLYP